jgi:DUF1365 family protein
MAIINNGILEAEVFHKRYFPKVHALKYKVFNIAMSLGDLAKLKETSAISRNKFNLYSFYDKDHGPRDGSSLEEWGRALLKKWKIRGADGDIVLMAMPRVLGYGFNPVSFWFFQNSQKELIAVLAEVNNTFGEHHSYMLFKDNMQPITKHDILGADKLFHVSPFNHVEGEYLFCFDYTQKRIGVWIDYFVDKKLKLATSIVGKRHHVNKFSFLKLFFRYPLLTFKVIFFIHLHALKIILKGIKHLKKPNPPEEEITR